jgi:hypothetical protein
VKRTRVRIDDLLTISFSREVAWADGFAGDRPDTFASRARARARVAKSADVAAFCNEWAAKWESQCAASSG